MKLSTPETGRAVAMVDPFNKPELAQDDFKFRRSGGFLTKVAETAVRRRWAILPLLAATAFGGTSIEGRAAAKAPSALTSHLEFGAFDEHIFSPKLEVAEQSAQWMAQDGFNAVEVDFPSNLYETTPDPLDKESLCDVFKAAEDYDLAVRVVMWGYKNGKLNYVPTTPAQISQYTHLGGEILQEAAGPYDPSSPGSSSRCVVDGQPIEKLQALDLQPTGEPNQEDFDMLAAINNQAAAEGNIRLLATLSPALHKLAKKLGIKLRIVDPGPSSHNNPASYEVAEGYVIQHPKKFGIKLPKSPLFDLKGYDPYGVNSQDPPWTKHKSVFGFGDLKRLKQIIYKSGANKQGVPLDFPEFGAETELPADKRDLYTGDSLRGHYISEGKQAVFYEAAIDAAYCNGSNLFLLHDVDDPELDKNWQSGLRYDNGEPKESLDPVRAEMKRAEDNQVKCPAHQ